jgi:ubiquinone/menaquinone biosynthesis C-methylase UbiE
MSRVSRDEFVAWNEIMAKRHDPDLYHTESPLPIRLLERRRVSVLIQLLDAQPNLRILEVGCGAGNVLDRVPTGTRVGIDLSAFLLHKAGQRLKKRASLLRMNAESLAFADASFDRVYCSEVLEHVIDPTAVLREIRRVLRPNGLAVISVPNEDAINRLKRTAFRIPGVRRLVGASEYHMADHMEDEWHLHEFDRAMLEDVASGLFEMETLASVPTRVLPLRYVARLRPLA